MIPRAFRIAFKLLLAVFAALLTPLLTGCALGPVVTDAPEVTTLKGAALQGKVYGGQQPVSGANVYLYAAGTGGYGGNGIAATAANASTSLLTVAVLTNNALNSGIDTNGHYYVTTNGTGSFSLAGDFSCATGQQLYLYAVGGNPGSGNNSVVGMLAALGECSTINSSTHVLINEVSTIATAYALAGFATDATHISSSGTALAQQGIANAFLTVTNLETLSTGAALATTPAAQGANGTVPQQEINSLANILAACVNSSSSSSTACTSLFATATSNGIPTGNTGAGAQATDTATAAFYIAQNPGSNVGTLYGITLPQAAFSPTLSGKPNDWSITLSFALSGTGFTLNNQIDGLAIDGQGNLWLTLCCSTAASLAEVNTLGTFVSGAAGHPIGSNPAGLAIDGSGNIWVSADAGCPNSEFQGCFIKFNSSGAILSGTNGYANNVAYPTAMAVEPSGNIWFINETNGGTPYIAEVNSTGGALATATNGGVNPNKAIAVNAAGNVWVANWNTQTLSEFNSLGTTQSSTGFTGGGLGSYEWAMAIDHSGDVWIASQNGSAVSEFNSSGVALSGSGFVTSGLSNPGNIAVDGAGHIWVGNGGTSSPAYVVLNANGASITPNTGLGSGISTANLAIDPSGNVWSGAGTSALNEMVGAAAPVVTPIVANLIAPYSAPASKP